MDTGKRNTTLDFFVTKSITNDAYNTYIVQFKSIIYNDINYSLIKLERFNIVQIMKFECNKEVIDTMLLRI